jgi:hypothetical protein
MLSRLLVRNLLVATLTILIFPLPGHSENKVMMAEATYTMGDGESPSFAEAQVLQRAKQMALEQAGTYVSSYTRAKNYDLTEAEIQTIAGGVMEVEVLEKSRALIGDGLRFHIKIKATVTTDKMEELATRVRGTAAAQQHKRLQDEYTRLTREIENWKQLLAKVPAGADRDAALDQIRDHEKAIEAIRRDQEVFYQRLVSGEQLYAEAAKQLADKKAWIEMTVSKLDVLLEEILERGHNITLGEPKVRTEIADMAHVELRVPVTITANESINTHLQETGTWMFNGLGEDPVLNSTIHEEIEGWQKVMPELPFAIEVEFNDGTVKKCYADNQKWRSRIEPGVFFIRTSPGSSSATFGLKLPIDQLKNITAIRGKFVSMATYLGEKDALEFHEERTGKKPFDPERYEQFKQQGQAGPVPKSGFDPERYERFKQQKIHNERMGKTLCSLQMYDFESKKWKYSYPSPECPGCKDLRPKR